MPGRSLNQARTNHFVIDSSHEPEAVSTVESFLAGISACGVTLVENLARSEGTPLSRIAVGIEGVRLASASNGFKEINLRFELAGVGQERAEELVQTYRER
jgi:uncharacterized OsmC-like protein